MTSIDRSTLLNSAASFNPIMQQLTPVNHANQLILIVTILKLLNAQIVSNCGTNYNKHQLVAMIRFSIVKYVKTSIHRP